MEILEENTETSPQTENGVIPIELWESQISHFERIRDIITIWHAYIDTSPMGAGKTIVTLAICAVFKLNLVVVGPLSTLSMWEEACFTYGIRLISAMTYQKFAGTKKGGCKHQFLIKMDDSYVATEYLRALIQDGTLFVFDEMHNLKNPDTAQLKASHTVAKSVVAMNCGSRISLLSATPCDKMKHTQSIMKMLGIIKNTNLYNYDPSTKHYELLGIKDLITYCDSVDKITSEAIHRTVTVTRRTCDRLCYDLYQGIVKNKLSSCMPLPKIEAMKDARNGYYEMNTADVEIIKDSEAALRKATHYQEETGTVTIGTGSWAEITKAQMGLESGKLNTMVRLAKEKLDCNPDNKVILYVWYIDSIKLLQEHLKEYHPLVMYGKTPLAQRTEMIKLFQEDASSYRLIISNAKVGGIGISLDDRSGTKPRYMFMIPSYNFIDMHQASGRIHRGTTKSNATVRFVYSKAFRGETSILNATARKTKIAKSMLYEDNDILFPGDYGNFIEGEQYEDLNRNDTDETLARRLQNEEYMNI